MDEFPPALVIESVAKAIPEEFHERIVVIGSLAAGYNFFKESEDVSVRTKDVDCVVQPRVHAAAASAEIVKRLLSDGWGHHSSNGFQIPAPAGTPHDKLPGIRLYPPSQPGWFLEFLTTPDGKQQEKRSWLRVNVPGGEAGLPAFRFLSLTSFKPLLSEFGIRYARPEMMALANLLEHPKLSHQTMSSPIEGRLIRRTSKDLGRVLALAHLDDDRLWAWPKAWREALEDLFPDEVEELLKNCGTGMYALLESEEDFEQAVHANNFGILSQQQTEPEMLRGTAARFVAEVLEEVGAEPG